MPGDAKIGTENNNVNKYNTTYSLGPPSIII